jgi:hypothetical protein
VIDLVERIGKEVILGDKITTSQLRIKALAVVPRKRRKGLREKVSMGTQLPWLNCLPKETFYFSPLKHTTDGFLVPPVARENAVCVFGVLSIRLITKADYSDFVKLRVTTK